MKSKLEVPLEVFSKDFYSMEDQREVNYQYETYFKYEYGSFSDEVKKVLEKNIVENKVNNLIKENNKERLFSLDVGCATGRYPLWFLSKGFNAYGYDIEESSIQICNYRKGNMENIFFENRNILKDKIESNKFHVVTCMMGTFNHIPSNMQKLFLDKIYETLLPGGLLIFSSWNPECSYTEFLQFYNRREKEHLNKNSLLSGKVKDILSNSNLLLNSIDHFAYLPNNCYDQWSGDVSKDQFLEIDNSIKKVLSISNSQMYLVTAVKE